MAHSCHEILVMSAISNVDTSSVSGSGCPGETRSGGGWQAEGRIPLVVM